MHDMKQYITQIISLKEWATKNNNEDWIKLSN